MVRAILSGQKTQTRRVAKGIALEFLRNFIPEYVASPENNLCPYGQTGDRLWVRENFAHIYKDNSKPINRLPNDCVYKADGFSVEKTVFGAWKPSIHMPRWASRITLEITGVRLERLNDISEGDAIAEGVKRSQRAVSPNKAVPCFWDYFRNEPQYRSACDSYASLWESINGAGSWEANPWVWVLEFKRIQSLPGIDAAQSAI
jgi:hypothetical protein